MRGLRVGPSAQSWINTTSVNTWGTIPASNTLSSINPDTDPAMNPNYPGTAPWRLALGSHAMMLRAWCGGTFDTSSGRIYYIDQGGHGDDSANGVIVTDLNRPVPVSFWLRKPSGAVGMAAISSGEWNQSPQVAELSDGRPRSRHTVNMSLVWPGQGPMNISEILLAPSGGMEWLRDRPYIISTTSGERVYLGANKFSNSAGGYVAGCYDSTRNVAWKLGSSSFQTLAKWGGPSNDAWTDVGGSQYYSGAVSLAYCPTKDLILVGNGGDDQGTALQTITGGWAVFDPATGITYTPTFNGAPALGVGYSTGLWPGLCQPQWSSYLGCFLAWDMTSGSTTQIMTITPPASGDARTTAWDVGYLTVSGSNAVTPSDAAPAGTYGKFWVWDTYKICGVVNVVNEAGYFFRYG